ncbi:MAG: hypothetical protein II821_05015 [Treponema sp.]|nr:hypothetical protein [Treponema sp.]
MLGVYLNIILIAFAVLSISAGLLFFVQKTIPLYLRTFTLLLSVSAFLICGGYAIMGFTADINYAFIPRFFGLFGINTFLLLELAYLLGDMKIKKIFRYIPIIFFALFGFSDLLLHGSKTSFTYIRHDLYTTYEISSMAHHIFHCCYVVSIALLLLLLSLKSYKMIKIKRDKRLHLSVIFANLFVLLAAVPDLTGSAIFEKCPSFIFCLGFMFVFFIWYYQIKRRASFIPSIENVSKEIFNTIDVPILIFDMNGILSMCNPSAISALRIPIEKENNLREIFTLRDVAALHIIAKAKKGINGTQDSFIKETGVPCTINYFVKLDYTGEPFCLIITVMNQGKEA